MWGRRRTLAALGVSLGVHVCALFLFARETSKPVIAKPAALQLTEVRWIEAEPPRPPPRGGTSGASHVRTKSRETPRPVAKPSTLEKLETDRPVSETPAPTGLKLLSAKDTRSVFAMPEVREAPRGRTLTPADMPTKEELLADEKARVEERVGGWAHSALAQARATNGLPDPAYGALGGALRDATDDVPQFIDTNSPKEVGKAFAESWLAGAERYGKTGAPYAEPEGRLESIEKPSALAAEAARGSPDAINMVNFLAAGARMQEFADGRAGLELYALVEVRQFNSGAVESVRMIRPSGLKPFDVWVVDKANEVAVSFTFDGGTREKPLRSVWRFDGIMKFRRKLNLKELNGRAAVGMVAMSLISALSSLGNVAPPDANGFQRPMGPRAPALVGRFDEMTGEVDMVDFTNPTYDCKVTLLEAD